MVNNRTPQQRQTELIRLSVRGTLVKVWRRGSRVKREGSIAGWLAGSAILPTEGQMLAMTDRNKSVQSRTFNLHTDQAPLHGLVVVDLLRNTTPQLVTTTDRSSGIRSRIFFITCSPYLMLMYRRRIA